MKFKTKYTNAKRFGVNILLLRNNNVEGLLTRKNTMIQRYKRSKHYERYKLSRKSVHPITLK